MTITATINGEKREIEVASDMPLLWLLRDELKLTGTKYGCGAALCGVCTVHLDGQPVRSCMVQAADIDGRSVTTIEGAEGKIAQAVIDAWVKLDVVQCGYCQPGQVMAAIGLLTENPKPSDADIHSAMDGNICRCATYQRIRLAVHEAAKALG